MLVLVLLYLQIALSSAVKSGNSVPNDFSLGKNASASSIVGGRPAAARRYPFMVQSSPSNCGGTLIHEDIVLSAAHCGGSFLSGVTIGGILRDGSDSEFFDVDSECLHPDYETAIIHDINDIMLIKLSTPSTAPLIKLNLDNPSIPARKEVLTAIGFGRTESGGFTSPVLLQVNLDTYPDASCEKQYSDYVPETLLCAGTIHLQACCWIGLVPSFVANLTYIVSYIRQERRLVERTLVKETVVGQS